MSNTKNINNTLSAIHYILNKTEKQRKIKKSDIFLLNNENKKNMDLINLLNHDALVIKVYNYQHEKDKNLIEVVNFKIINN